VFGITNVAAIERRVCAWCRTVRLLQ